MLNFTSTLPLDSEEKKYPLFNTQVLMNFLSTRENSEQIEVGIMQIEKFVEKLQCASDSHNKKI